MVYRNGREYQFEEISRLKRTETEQRIVNVEMFKNKLELDEITAIRFHPIVTKRKLSISRDPDGVLFVSLRSKMMTNTDAKAPKTPSYLKESTNETLQVFCRLRPIANEQSCVHIESNTTVELTVPDTSVNSRPNVCVKHAFSFRKVFSDKCGQKEVFDEVAMPLVEKLIKDGNGLLFTYGVTGSGKTYTMTGVRNNFGIMPRCVDVLFNSIAMLQTPYLTRGLRQSFFYSRFVNSRCARANLS